MSQGVGLNASINSQSPQLRNTGHVSNSGYYTTGVAYGAHPPQPNIATTSSNIRTSNYAPQMGTIPANASQSSSYKPTVPDNRATYTAHYVPASNSYEVDQYNRSSTQNRVSQPQAPPQVAAQPMKSTVNQNEPVVQGKKSNVPYLCWGLLGLLALTGLILGILFGLNVIGRNDTVIDPTVKNNSTSTTTTTSSTTQPAANSSTNTSTNTVPNGTTSSSTTSTTSTTTIITPTTTTTTTTPATTTVKTTAHQSPYPVAHTSHMRTFSDMTN